MQLNELLDYHNKAMLQTQSLLRQCPWENSDFYADWCAQGYYFVCHATRILAASAARTGIERDHLHIRFLDHSQEEKHHEKLYERDLAAMGRSISEFSEMPATAFLYQCQYYLLEHKDPIAPMGGIFYLEGVSVFSGVEIYERVKGRFGAEASTFLKVHVHDDEDHIKKAKQILGSMSPSELKVTSESYKLFHHAYEQQLLGLVERLNSKSKTYIKTTSLGGSLTDSPL